MPVRKEWPNVLLSHVVKVLLTLLKAEKEGVQLSVTELIEKSGIHSSTFYATVRRALEEGQLIAVEPNPRERVIYVKLTEKGRRLAECLESLGIEVG